MKKDAKIIGVWGGRGSGKSTRIKELVKQNHRVIVADPIGEYGEAGFQSYKTHEGLYKALKGAWNSGFRMALDISEHPDMQASFLRLSRDLRQIQKPYYDGKDSRMITLVVDEMSLLVPNRSMAAGETDFLMLCNVGRHYGIEIIGASQRLAQVHMDFRGNCAENYYFRTTAHVDKQAARQILGPSHADELAGLSPHEYLHFKDGQIISGVNDFARQRRRAGA